MRDPKPLYAARKRNVGSIDSDWLRSTALNGNQHISYVTAKENLDGGSFIAFFELVRAAVIAQNYGAKTDNSTGKGKNASFFAISG